MGRTAARCPDARGRPASPRSASRTPVGDLFGVAQIDLGETAPCMAGEIVLSGDSSGVVGGSQSLSATVTERWQPIAGAHGTFTVFDGPNAG